MLLDIFRDVFNMQCVYDIVSYICPFRHFNYSSLKLRSC